MPFQNKAFLFTRNVIDNLGAVGAVYGLFRQSSPGYFVCLYVGETDNLRRRLMEHLNNPPIGGITHFFAEAVPGSLQRAVREEQLIGEFNPPGNVRGRR